jgi:alkaline phosphatase D
MVGYSEMKEVMLWVQTTKAASVRISYWEEGTGEQKYVTDNVITKEEDAFTAKLIANKVEPGKVYSYQLLINTTPVDLPYETSFRTQELWQWRTDPPDIRFAAGSCAYINEKKYDRPGNPYGGNYQIFESIHRKDPDFMVWLGDNFYLREADWNTRTGIHHRFTHGRSLPELQPLLGSVHHYAIWDDHDYGPNNSDRGFWFKNTTLEAFELFWANPSYGTGDIKGTITFFKWGDLDFFLLDNRFYRSPNNLLAENKSILGDEQLRWLFDGLISSRATYKFVVMGGQFLNTSAEHETYSNYGFDGERQRIIDFIHEQDIKGVIFLTGDRHFTELSMLAEEGEPVIYDLTTSPLTAGPYSDATGDVNDLHVEGTLVTERNFSVINVTGPREGREILIKVFDSNGEQKWEYRITNNK